MKKLIISAIIGLATLANAQLNIITVTNTSTTTAVTDYELPPYVINGFIQQVSPGSPVTDSMIDEVRIKRDTSAHWDWQTNMVPNLVPTYTTNVVNGTNAVTFTGYTTNGFTPTPYQNWYTGTNFNVHTTLR